MPYVTEEIYTDMTKEDSIMISDYPKVNNQFNFDNTSEVESLILLIQKIRKAKLDNKIGKDFGLLNDNDLVNNNKSILEKMTKVDIIDTNSYNKTIDLLVDNNIIKLLYNEDLKDDNYYQNLNKEIERLKQSIERRKNLLSNEGYVSKAPSNIVDREKNDLKKEEEELTILLNDK
jgi:valyl-tRNA synthetase